MSFTEFNSLTPPTHKRVHGTSHGVAPDNGSPDAETPRRAPIEIESVVFPHGVVLQCTHSADSGDVVVSMYKGDSDKIPAYKIMEIFRFMSVLTTPPEPVLITRQADPPPKFINKGFLTADILAFFEQSLLLVTDPVLRTAIFLEMDKAFKNSGSPEESLDAFHLILKPYTSSVFPYKSLLGGVLFGLNVFRKGYNLPQLNIALEYS